MLEGLDFSRCSTLDACFTRVEVVLMQADAVHNRRCLTRRRAMNLLRASKKSGSYPLSNYDKALIIANAVFPLHCVNFYALQTAINPDSGAVLSAEEKLSLSTALRTKNHLPLIHFLGL